MLFSEFFFRLCNADECHAVEFPSCRVVFTALAFFGFLNIYCLRVNLSVALVAMVNATEEVKNFTENETDSCGNKIEHKKHHDEVSCSERSVIVTLLEMRD